ncbi:MAG: hypothetical protein ETSY2_46870 [Candidatus Entotheonella gemina]|uniref:DUF1640 domain-containing protein n=1 Tax=Candidatus Entotheonella gemina TaxID=1429439 RepID=W4LE30_9BACT|nr:MAG: hypothetical protein ETSY2_46870 [Candidatus Entotheonella gemina]
MSEAYDSKDLAVFKAEILQAVNQIHSTMEVGLANTRKEMSELKLDTSREISELKLELASRMGQINERLAKVEERLDHIPTKTESGALEVRLTRWIPAMAAIGGLIGSLFGVIARILKLI